MIISHVKIIAFQTIVNHRPLTILYWWKTCSLYNKKKNTWVLGNTRFILSVEHDIMFNTQSEAGISKHPCIFLYVIVHACK